MTDDESESDSTPLTSRCNNDLDDDTKNEHERDQPNDKDTMDDAIQNDPCDDTKGNALLPDSLAPQSMDIQTRNGRTSGK